MTWEIVVGSVSVKDEEVLKHIDNAERPFTFALYDSICSLESSR